MKQALTHKTPEMININTGVKYHMNDRYYRYLLYKYIIIYYIINEVIINNYQSKYTILIIISKQV